MNELINNTKILLFLLISKIIDKYFVNEMQACSWFQPIGVYKNGVGRNNNLENIKLL
jgi:hypothetical protein